MIILLYIVIAIIVLFAGFVLYLIAIPSVKIRRADMPQKEITTHEIQQDILNQAFKEEPKKTASDTPKELIEATYLGGSSKILSLNSQVYIFCGANSLLVKMQDRDIEERVMYAEIKKLDIAGSGFTQSNAGVVGGGFGVEGFLKGVIAAAAINLLTTKTQNNTFLAIETLDRELFFHITKHEPFQLRLLMSAACKTKI